MQPNRRLLALRLAAIAGQAATIVVTWPLWQDRAEPPQLPALPCTLAFDFGVALLLTLVLAVVCARVGTLAHGILLAIAMLADQSREQPQVLSLFVLMVAALPVRGAQALGAWHLAALWAWAGIGKLTSARYYDTTAAFLFAPGTPLAAAPVIAVAAALAAAELTLGVLAL